MKTQKMGIYCLTNTTTGKRFINSTKNTDTYMKYLIKNLDTNKHKNLRLLEAWQKYKDFFLFEVLEELEDAQQLSSRKEYWVNYYRSNEVDYGYNLEIYKRPWEKARDDWKKCKTWGVEGNVQNILNSIVKELDYNIEFSEDRLKLVLNILNDEKEEWLLNYISSPLFCEKQRKSKKDYLTENDISLIGLSYIVDYLTFPKYKNHGEKKLKSDERHPIRKKKSDVHMDYRRGNEKLFGHKTEVESETSTLSLKIEEGQVNQTVATQHVINKSDLNTYPEIKFVYDTMQYLRAILGQGLNKEDRGFLQQKLIEKYGDKQVAYMKKMLRDLSTEILIMKEVLSGVIRFKRVTDGTTVYNYDQDTGYFDEKDDYVFVSESKIDLSKEKHVLELLNHYEQLKKRFYNNPDSDMWAILFDLDELIENTEFDVYMRDIMFMKIDGYSASEIIEVVKNKHGVEVTENRLSKIYNEIIPKMIVETYQQKKEDWIYTFKVKGTYKTCAKCKQVKLSTSKYFSLNKQNKDGLHSYCKRCR